MFKKNKKNDEELTAAEAREKTAEAKEEQFRKFVVDAWSHIKLEIESGHTNALVWTTNTQEDIVTRAIKHFENLGYKVTRSDHYISISWGVEK